MSDTFKEGTLLLVVDRNGVQLFSLPLGGLSDRSQAWEEVYKTIMEGLPDETYEPDDTWTHLMKLTPDEQEKTLHYLFSGEISRQQAEPVLSKLPWQGNWEKTRDHFAATGSQ